MSQIELQSTAPAGSFEALRRFASGAAAHADAERRRRIDTLRGGARLLLAATEWEIERVLHLGRLAIWMAFYAMVLIGWQVSIGAMMAVSLQVAIQQLTGQAIDLGVVPGGGVDRVITAISLVMGGAAWWVYWHILARSTAWRWLRFVVVLIDTLTVVRFAVAARSAGAAFTGFGLTVPQLGGTLPSALLLILVSGILRLNPYVAFWAGVMAILGQVAVSALLGLDGPVTSAQITLLALTFVLGMQFVFVLRGLGLKAAQEDVLERFVPQGLTQRLANAGGSVPARVIPVTNLIADLRGFTTISEPLGPTEAVALLNEFFATMVEPLATEGAVLDKYLGDGMLAFVEGEGHAARGLRAARRIVAAMAEANAGREQPIGMGIAVHTAQAFVGSIGAPARMEYTIIGDAVNVTSRLEGLMSSKAGAERLHATLVASADAVNAAAADGVSYPELVGPVQVAVHGRAHHLDAYYLPA